MQNEKFYLSQIGHTVRLLDPISGQGLTYGDAFSMKNWTHASIIIQMGAAVGAGTAVTFKVMENASATATANGTSVAFKVAKCEVDPLAVNSDIFTGPTGLTTLTDVTAAAGFVARANTTAGAMYVIELDASDLDDGYPFVQVTWSDPAVAKLMNIVAVLSGGRYANDASPTVLS